MNYEQQYGEYLAVIEQRLQSYCEGLKNGSVVRQAMEYALLNGGKRIRPVLALAFCDMLGGDVQKVLPYACALEMVHTYSLIHDDLPCMDNDDMRRGKPSCHKAFGEEYALLAGDGLLTLAFETVLGRYGDTDPACAYRCGAALAAAAGVDGMIGGQTLDLLSEGKQIALEELQQLHALKTGALLIAPCLMAVYAAQGSTAEEAAAKQFGAAIGLQFQIVDDILDTVGSEDLLGKPVGSDAENEKSTYVSLLGLECARTSAQEQTEKALAALAPFGEKAWFLKELTCRLATREK